ncbi:carboxypeptidase-like regulatory domain-containing protein [Mucilaginibacter calamicampi]|uniref:Carboxypeptidase-like regulatory domain-containing protein n=1 Tax=Mucilaginibacter calamicampi TaxID=1302352 RepID=A0ABW2YYD9_9SPHI
MPVTLRSYKFYCCLLLLFMVCGSLSFAQVVRGRVIDSASSTPIPNASVYLNGSSTGTTTNEQGEFTLRAKAGNVPLIVSCIGYESETITKYGSETFTVRLVPRALMLNEVTINVGGMSREKQLALFLKEFIGSPADGCTITNADELKFSFSKKANKLSATADKPLQIVNKRTGYKITYFLKTFTHNDTTTRILGNYFFSEDTAGLKQAELRKIYKNREKYYYGSKMHFIRSLWEDNLKKNKFELYNNLYYGGVSIPASLVVAKVQGQKYFNYSNTIYIVYRNNVRNATALRLAPAATEGIIDSDGYYDPDFTWGGEMADQRMAQLLPFEYHPDGESPPESMDNPAVKQPMFDSLLNLYAAKHRSPLLFMHFDKNVYSNNENVWFTGYLLDYIGNYKYKTLGLALIKDDDRSVLMDDRFVIKNGFCFGNTVIPDSVRAGTYTFVAYGNLLKNNLPDIIFKQQVTIKTGSQQTFNASLNPLDTSATGANQKVMLLVNFNEKSPPSSVPVSYYVGNPAQPVTTGAVKTSSGQYIFSIPSNLLTAGNNKLHVQVKYKTEVQDLSMALPVPPQPAQINFYPEGGNLLSNVVNIVGIEAKTAAGAPLSTEAALYEDEQIISAINTNGNGMGRFAVIPQPGKKYRVQLNAGNSKSYYLPGAVSGAGLSIKRAVVNDTLLVDVYSDDPLRKLYLVGHNYRQTFFETPVERFPNQRVKILLNGMPRGVMQLTLVDSLGRPYAERMVFAHYTGKDKLAISADNADYGKRNKVKLRIKLTGESTNGAVSVAVVQENRLELKNKTDIENYIYLNNEISDIPVKDSYFTNADLDRRDLENVLLIRGWSRYKWTDVLKIRPEDTLYASREMVFSGKVSKYAGKFKNAVPLVTFAPASTYSTDINGLFELPDSNLVTEPGKKVVLMVAGGTPSDYKIQLLNPYDSVSRHLSTMINPVPYLTPAQENSNLFKLASTEHAIQLKEAVIKAKKDDFFNQSSAIGQFGTNSCGDYVCRFHVFNCPNHRNESDNRPAIVGEVYNGRVYMGCKNSYPLIKQPNSLTFKGIYAAQEFYPADYSEINPSQPEYVSTLYWKGQLMLKKDEAQELSFYTSDITGAYKVIVQGITDNDVIYGETLFNVNK